MKAITEKAIEVFRQTLLTLVPDLSLSSTEKDFLDNQCVMRQNIEKSRENPWEKELHYSMNLKKIKTRGIGCLNMLSKYSIARKMKDILQ